MRRSVRVARLTASRAAAPRDAVARGHPRGRAGARPATGARRRRRRARAARRVCPRCGAEQAGAATRRCSRCGAELVARRPPPALPAAPHRRAGRWRGGRSPTDLALVPTRGTRAALERRTAAREQAALESAERRRLRREGRPRTAALPERRGDLASARRRAVRATERLITADARARVRRGALDGPVIGTRCRPDPRHPQASGARSRPGRRPAGLRLRGPQGALRGAARQGEAPDRPCSGTRSER
jgi:hypothetical protein